MNLDVRALASNEATELYLTATPTPGTPLARAAREIFSAIAHKLRTRDAWIAQERVFAPPGAAAELRPIRSQAYGVLDDGVEPTWLAGQHADGQFCGAQVHAICGLPRPRRLEVEGTALGRTFEQNGCRWLSASNLGAADLPTPREQARAAYEQADALLRQAGGEMRHVARTWIFMDDILSWYGQFNEARTQFFLERGLLGPNADGRMPASTGIGVSPAIPNGTPARCAMDMLAVIGAPQTVRRFHAAGKQRSAYEYGSAFARAATARTPAGLTVYVSGTAAIDPSGATCHVGDIAGQVQMTLENVVAVLKQLDASPADVVQAMAYCASPAVEEHFTSCWQNTLPWPWLTMIGDVCRDDLLFEVEATACLGARRL